MDTAQRLEYLRGETRKRPRPKPPKAHAAHLKDLEAGKQAYEDLYGPITDWMLDQEFSAFEARSAKKARQYVYQTRQPGLTINKEHRRTMSNETKARRRGRRQERTT